MEKEKYLKPEFEIILLKSDDVITESGKNDDHEMEPFNPWGSKE